MRRREKKQVKDFIYTLNMAQDEIKKLMESAASQKQTEASDDNRGLILQLLGNCQDGAIQMGNLIETVEGEDCPVIPMLEEYCETVYRMYEVFGQGDVRAADKLCKLLRRQLSRIEHSVTYEIRERTEVVFLPYKASMWDSMESVWMAADADENCDAYVVPIPYYDRNPDCSLGKYHYEGEELPDDVPVVHYDSYHLEKRRPDAVYIHNPYDAYNYVTTIDPRYYSKELKKYTDTLVYIPYYATTGGMADGQRSCAAYYYADYIVTQAEKYRKFFDEDLPDYKFLPFGSPKFDRIIRICGQPPEPPAEWKEKLAGKKVYFYNTSLNGMLGNTDAFLKKMKYVFDCFKSRDDACLLWRPHPLFESTLESMRAPFIPIYRWLKAYFMEHGLGIYDDTPDMTSTIAHCDAYIGDGATSVPSLFGIVGKPLFILDNVLHTEPEEDDWRGRAVPGFNVLGKDDWIFAQGNKLYYSENSDYQYRYFCDLSDYNYGSYYSQVITIGEKHYVCPANARDIVVISGGEIEKRVELSQCIEQAGAFCGAYSWGRYLFLLPNNYPAVVRYDTESGEILYLGQNLDVFRKEVNGEKRIGGSWLWKGVLYLASPTDDQVLAMDAETGEEQVITLNRRHPCGCMGLIPDGEQLWILPYEGYVVARWNPVSGELQEYEDYPAGLVCTQIPHGYECSLMPFSVPAFCGDDVYFPPQWANMFVRLDKRTGRMEEWKPPMDLPEEWKNGYYYCGAKGCFTRPSGEYRDSEYHLFSCFDRKLYRIDLETGEYREVPVGFDREELERNEPGFGEESEWMQYACVESAFNSLTDFLDGRITGHAFVREKQVQAFSRIAANNDGTCGEKTHRFIERQIDRAADRRAGV